jgi:hypothetical protein
MQPYEGCLAFILIALYIGVIITSGPRWGAKMMVLYFCGVLFSAVVLGGWLVFGFVATYRVAIAVAVAATIVASIIAGLVLRVVEGLRRKP